MPNERMMMVVRAPLYKYPGGKRSELQHCFRYIPPFSRYVEAFFGGGALFFRLRDQLIQDGTPCHVNDLDLDVSNCLLVLKQSRLALVEELSSDRYALSERQYLWIRDQFSPSSPVERAAQFYYLRQSAYRGIVRTGPTGQSNVSFGRREAHPRRPLYDLFSQRFVRPGKRLLNLNRLRDPRLDDLLASTIITNEDFQSVLKRYEDPATFAFCDPPYLDCEGGYAQAFGPDDHRRLADAIRSAKCQCMVVVSSTPLTERLYDGFIVHRYSKKYILRIEDAPKPVEHLVACNYRPPARKRERRLF